MSLVLFLENHLQKKVLAANEAAGGIQRPSACHCGRKMIRITHVSEAVCRGLVLLSLNARPQMKTLARFFTVLVLSPAMAGAGGGAGLTNTNPPAAEVLPQRSMLGMGGIVTTPERKVSPRFGGKSLPIPPKQHSPWTAPTTNLPTNYISATSALFEEGLTDPRDCEYREIEVGTGNVWTGDGGVVATHGWILPGTNGGPFAVCWNGLVYPVASIGTNADLTADVANLVTNGGATWYSAIPEGMSVSQSSLLGMKGCMLWRLGLGDLAVGYWQGEIRRKQAFQSAMFSREPVTNAPSTNAPVPLPDTDPYLEWVTDWVWAMFNRLICAHERGDEALALVTARQLSEVQPKIEEECFRRGFREPLITGVFHSPGMVPPLNRPYMNFLGQLPQILADLERREKEGEHENVAQSGAQAITNQTERIAALVRDLDLVEARQWGQPGWVNLAEDPVVSALTAEGDPAVEPLLDCLEKDKRLTRSVGFGRDFQLDRTVIPVASAAMVALQDILHGSFGGAAEIRAYWNLNKGMKLEDRWYAILKDDSGSGRWLEAAGNITQPENVTTTAGGWTATRQVPTNTPIPLRGEVLRSKTNPSVTELMARRALEVPAGNPSNYDLGAACRMGLNLAAWDAAAADPVAKTLVKRACTLMNYSGKQLGTYVAKLSLACAKAGDFQPFQDYAAWLKTTTPEQLDRSIMECIEPLREFPTNEVLESAAEALFGDSNSTWGKLPWKGLVFDNPVESDLVHVRAFRILLIRELGKTNVCGTFTWRAPDMLQCQNTVLNQNGGRRVPSFEGGPPADGTTTECRWCDWIAASLAITKQIPLYNPFDPVEKRDEEIRTAISVLQPR
jgi:hypothetical protein